MTCRTFQIKKLRVSASWERSFFLSNRFFEGRFEGRTMPRLALLIGLLTCLPLAGRMFTFMSETMKKLLSYTHILSLQGHKNL